MEKSDNHLFYRRKIYNYCIKATYVEVLGKGRRGAHDNVKSKLGALVYVCV